LAQSGVGFKWVPTRRRAINEIGKLKQGVDAGLLVSAESTRGDNIVFTLRARRDVRAQMNVQSSMAHSKITLDQR